MKQNEIWLINLDPTLGAEIKKTRPAIIINDNALGKLPLKIIAPWMVKIISLQQTGLNKISSADCFQIRSVSEQRFIKKIGLIDNETQEKIKIALSKVLSIYP
jgi:mRNA interferase MazF